MNWISLQSIPPAGLTLTLTDAPDSTDGLAGNAASGVTYGMLSGKTASPSGAARPLQWLSPLTEFQMPCRLVTSVTAELFLLPQAEGVLVRGRITGTVALPCRRCAEDALVELDHRFDTFEPFPAGAALPPVPIKDEEADELEVDSSVMRLASHNRGIEMNPAALAWEEFSLALPVNPLCDDDCKGLCPACGANRNTTACACAGPDGDERLAPLKNLKIVKK